MLPAALALTSQEGVAAIYGAEFAAGVFAHAGEDWFGPIVSPFGAHLVRISAREAGRAPVVDEIRPRLREDWIAAQRRAAREAHMARLRQRYDVRVDWPEPYASQEAPGVIPRLHRPLDVEGGE
jgi:hypothetical protein